MRGALMRPLPTSKTLGVPGTSSDEQLLKLPNSLSVIPTKTAWHSVYHPSPGKTEVASPAKCASRVAWLRDASSFNGFGIPSTES